MSKSKNSFLNIIIEHSSRYLSIHVLSHRSLGYILFNIFAILILILMIFQFSKLDLYFQKIFYQGNGQWLINRNDEFLKLIFYIIPKKIITIFLSALLIFAIYLRIFEGKNKKIKEIKMMLSYVLLSAIGLVLLVGLLKQTTNMYCPDTIKEFGGMGDFLKLFDVDGVNNQFYKRGKCFPAGHASTGYSLIPITFIIRKQKIRIGWFLFSFTLGSILGFYQMAKGVHYLSDTIVTFMLALICGFICYIFLIKKEEEFQK